jgi:hypothetical protein
MAIYQQALDVTPFIETVLDVDISFSCSAMIAAMEKEGRSHIPYFVITGYSGDHRIALSLEQAKKLRRHFEENGAKHILSFTDEASSEDTRWHPGHPFMRESYQFLLEKVLQTPWLGLVIKPKRGSTLHQRLGPIASLLKRAESTGRCFIYEKGPPYGHPPALAALSADIAIHGHLCAPTAAFEAALTGKSTLLMDREGWPVSPLYQLGEGKVVFKDWQTLWKACEEHWKREEGIPGFGDWSFMLDQLDPFRDGRAAERMGTYLQWLLEGFKSGLNRETAMADAAERYCKLWGRDKIVSI